MCCPAPEGVTADKNDLFMAQYARHISYGKYSAHPGGANTAFLDGHAESLDMNKAMEYFKDFYTRENINNQKVVFYNNFLTAVTMRWE